MLKLIQRLIARVKWSTNNKTMHKHHMVFGTCKCWNGTVECGAPLQVRKDCLSMLTKYRTIETVYNHSALNKQLEDEALKRFNSFIDVEEDKRFQDHLRSLNS